jgi:hypothetical protein
MTNKTMTFYAPIFHGPNGRMRHVAVSLPYVGCIADEAHYQQPPPPQPKDHSPAMSERNIRKILGRDRKQAARARDKVGYEHVLRRIRTQGF